MGGDGIEERFQILRFLLEKVTAVKKQSCHWSRRAVNFNANTHAQSCNRISTCEACGAQECVGRIKGPNPKINPLIRVRVGGAR